MYICYPNWAGNASQGGSVVGINAQVSDTWCTPGGGDWGDNIIYAKVHMNRSNPVSSQNFAKMGIVYRDVPFQQSICPTRNNMCFYIGPWGSWHN